MMDDGVDVVELPLPGLITVVKEIGDPRVPSLKNKMKAKKIGISVFTAEKIGAEADKIGLAGSPTQVVGVFAPKARGNRLMLEGAPDVQVRDLVARLKEDKILGVGGES